MSGLDPQIMQDFITESGELLERVEADLVELESRPRDLDLLNQIFRALHTIKGSASFLALTELVEIAHAGESALNAARNRQIVVGSGEMDLLLAAVDIIRVQIDEIIHGAGALSKADQNLIDHLTRVGNGEAVGGSANTATSDQIHEPAPSATPHGRAIGAHGLGAIPSGRDPEHAEDQDPIAVSMPTGSEPDARKGTPAKGQPEQTIRVDIEHLETLMNLVGELVLQKNRVLGMAEELGRIDRIDPSLAEQMEFTARMLDRVTGDIRMAVMRTRMQPLSKLFGKYPRLIRDLASKTGKALNLVIEGGDTEVDKSVIEELGDPLVHLLRNSVDHGIEAPAERQARGKPRTGTIAIQGGREGSHIRVRVIDDGRGLSRDKIGAKAVERGLVSPDQLGRMSDEEVFRFILHPGFSTAEVVSDISGRGVGMDVVRTNIESKLKGSLTIGSAEGKGTTLTITIPLTLAIMPAMMVSTGGEIYAIALNSILEIVRPEPGEIASVDGFPVIHLRGSVLPIISAQEVLGVPRRKHGDEDFIVVIAHGGKHIGLRVSGVIGQQEIVMKPLDGIDRAGPVSGATTLNDGGVGLIIDIARLVRAASKHARAAHGAGAS